MYRATRQQARGQGTIDLLTVFAKQAEPEWQLHWQTIRSYFLRLLSCTLQRSTATSILRRSASLSGNFRSPAVSKFLHAARSDIINVDRSNSVVSNRAVSIGSSTTSVYGTIRRYTKKKKSAATRSGPVAQDLAAGGQV